MKRVDDTTELRSAIAGQARALAAGGGDGAGEISRCGGIDGCWGGAGGGARVGGGLAGVGVAAAGQLLAALIQGDFAFAEQMTTAQARQDIAGITKALKPSAYDRFELIARGRVAHHYFLKARLTGGNVAPFTIQFRLGEDNGKW